MGTRVCCKCRAERPTSDFGPRKGRPGGLRYQCRPCDSAYMRAYYARNADECRRKRREYHMAHREEEAARDALRWKLNPAKERARARSYRERNAARVKPKAIARTRSWVASHRAERKAIAAKYAARKRGATVSNAVTAASWAERLTEYEFCCAYCLRHQSACGKLEQEHLTPLSRGGDHDISNILPACRSCNASKNDRHLLEYLFGAQL